MCGPLSEPLNSPAAQDGAQDGGMDGGGTWGEAAALERIERAARAPALG